MKWVSKTRIFVSIMLLAILITASILIIVNSQQQKRIAELTSQIAAIEAEQSNKEVYEADLNTAEVIRLTKIANEQAEVARVSRAAAEAAQQETEKLRGAAVEALKKAEIAQANAKSNSALAIQMEKEAEAQAQKARQAETAATRLRYLAQAKAMSMKSLELGDDPEQEALVAQQAYKFNFRQGGNPCDQEIYNGLYKALDRLNNPLSRSLYGHSKGAARALVASTKSQEIYSGGGDGRILRWFRKGGEWKPDSIMGGRKDYQIYKIDLSSDANWLIASGALTTNVGKGYVEVFDLKNPGKSPKKISGFSQIKTLIYSLTENGAFVQDDMSIKFTDFNTVQEVIKLKEKINAIAMCVDGRKLAGAGVSGAVYFWDIADKYSEKIVYQNQVEITALAFTPDKNRIVIGDKRGSVKIITEDSNLPPGILLLSGAHIEQIVFNNAGTALAAASRDQKLRIWNWNKLTLPPVAIEHEGQPDWTWSATFSPDDSQLLVGVHSNSVTNKEVIRVWPTQFETMSSSLCEHVKRNLSKDEWDNFVGSDLPYEKTCDNLPANNR